mmetsp:Transcript_124701/g.248982  ORF Transcript_124701/g.248982 Transcript_124701/m.248982 type:complete len:85 (-) Transcript_124701:67-321(-)
MACPSAAIPGDTVPWFALSDDSSTGGDARDGPRGAPHRVQSLRDTKAPAWRMLHSSQNHILAFADAAARTLRGIVGKGRYHTTN